VPVTLDNVPGYALDDPYEGELLVVLCDLFCEWSDPALRERVWQVKRAKLHAVPFKLVTPPASLQLGFWHATVSLRHTALFD
jgi:hypothetical protein